MRSKRLAIIVIFCLLMNITGVPAMAALGDIDNHWARATIEKWVSAGYIAGYPDGNFEPDRNISRVEFVTLVNKAFKKNTPAEIHFTDVASSDWFYQQVAAGVYADFIGGYPDGTFRPHKALDRQEAAVIVARLLNLSKSNTDLLDEFADAGDIESWARENVNSVVNAAIMNGYPDGTFGPQNTLTRAEAVVMLDKALAKLPNNQQTTTTGSSHSGGGGGGGSISDTTAPSITITAPTSEPVYATTETRITLAGTASDNIGVASVSYSVYGGGSGQAVGTTNWTVPALDLLPGSNIITLTVKDRAGNTSTDSITINYDMGRIEPLDLANLVTDEATGQEFVADQILVTFKADVSQAAVDQTVYAINGEIVGYLSGMNDYQIKINGQPSLAQLKAIVELLNADPNVDIALLNEVLISEEAIPGQGQDPEWFTDSFSGDSWNETDPAGRNWGLEAIKAPSAWEHNAEMNSLKIGILDVGFDIDHQDLNIPAANDKIASETGTPREHYHGTHVAGTIGALSNNTTGVTGIVWNKQLYTYAVGSVGTIDEFSRSQIFEYKYGLLWLLEHGSKVVNMSLGVNLRRNNFGIPSDSNSADVKRFIEDPRAYWTPFVQRLVNNGYDFVFVQSAGNDGVDAKWNGFLTSIDDPELNKRIIIVGAMERNNAPGDLLTNPYSYVDNWAGATYGSNYGARVDVVAPGADIFSLTRDDAYNNLSGTSMAAPHVSGVASLVWAINPDLTGPQVKAIVTGTADRPITYKGRSYGIVNADAAVDRAKSTEATQPISQPVNGVLLGKIRAASGVDLAGASIAVSKGDAQGDYFASTVSEVDGSFELILAPGHYKIFISKPGYISTFTEQDVVESTPTYLPVIMLPETSNELGRVEGTIKNAFDGTGVSGLTISFRKGINVVSGEVYTTTTTTTGGSYSIDLPAGNYTGEISGTGFSTGYFYVVSEGGATIRNQNGTVTPVLAAGQTRIILTWGETPSDLDSHLTGPLADGRFHLYYPQAESNGGSYWPDHVKLDLDDVTSYGPETTTIYQQVTDSVYGPYEFYVHDYTNLSSGSSTALSNSGAKVQVIRGTAEGQNVILATFNVPVGQEGTLWKVFSLDGDTITPINQMSYEDNPTQVGGVEGQEPTFAASVTEEQAPKKK